ncbi:MAG: hypothetical protein U0354_15655 [Candidatus Sericytochromatia bacterium]
MSMKRVQVQFDESDYQTIRKIGFIENRAISEIIREATKSYLKSRTDVDNKIKEIFASENEVENALNDSIDDFYEVYEKLAQ